MVEAPLTRKEKVGENTYILGVRERSLAAKTAAGQFFMLRGWGATPPLWSRPFSICDIRDDELSFMIRAFGEGSEKLVSMNNGEKIALSGPLGNPVSLQRDRPSYILVAGGIGLAPFPILTKLIRKAGPSSRITLIYGEKTASMVVNTHSLIDPDVRLVLTTDDGSLGRQSTTVDALAEILGRGEGESGRDIVFACGPKPMLRAIQVNPGCRHAEILFFMEELMACGFGTCMGCVVGMTENGETRYVRVCREGPVFDGKRVVL